MSRIREGARKAKSASKKASERARRGAETASASVAQKTAAAKRRAVQEAARNAQDVSADTAVDSRKKDRNKEFVKRVQAFAEMSPPTTHTLETMDRAPAVSEQARAPLEEQRDGPAATTLSYPSVALGGTTDADSGNRRDNQPDDSLEYPSVGVSPDFDTEL